MANNANPHVVIDDDDHDDHIGPFAAIPDFCGIARGLMNSPSRRDGCWSSTETRLFREFFGTSVEAVAIVWDLLARDSLLPEKGRPKHLLWALHFMKAYPKQGPGCSVVGASAGAVDPKTFRKWVWVFIGAIADLVDEVVSFFIYSQCEDGADDVDLDMVSPGDGEEASGKNSF
jgi:hypothetical protein